MRVSSLRTPIGESLVRPKYSSAGAVMFRNVSCETTWPISGSPCADARDDAGSFALALGVAGTRVAGRVDHREEHLAEVGRHRSDREHGLRRTLERERAPARVP